MTHGDLDKVSPDAPAVRNEIIAVVTCLTEQVARLALQVERLVAIADARGKRSALQRRRKKKTVAQPELKSTSAATTRDAQSVEMAEATKFPLSSQQDSCVGNANRGETALINNLTPQLEAALQSHDTNWPEENAVAARVAELHERLRGFIKPSLPQPNQNT